MVSNKVLVSIIIPTFNRLSYLKNTLICLQNQQTKIQYEIIIVDSGTDNTIDYLKGIKKQNNRLINYKKIKHCKNRSLLRNKGARIAKGDLLIFIDNDMLVAPDFIEKIYNTYNNNPNIIVLGKRTSLTEFDINLFGKENLVKNFNKLFEYPAIRDDRELYLDDLSLTTETAEKPWRFLFSHSFCINKHTYFRVGGFDKDFGNKWGCEDLELGFKLYEKGCNFILSNEIISFHQPHLSQSQMQQKEGRSNNDLFVKKHPYADVELDLSLYKFFQEDYIELKSIKSKTNFSYVNNIRGFDFILGTIKDIKDSITWPKQCLLGTRIPVQRKVKKILILKTIYKMNYRIKLTIISEAFRVTNNVWFEKDSNEHQAKKELFYLYENFDRLGLVVQIIEEKNFYKVTLTNRITKKLLALFLCDISSYEKRLVYLFLAKKFREKDWKVNVVDLRRKETEKGEDFILDTTYRVFDDYSYWSDSAVISSLNNKFEKYYKPLAGDNNYVVDDTDFPYPIKEQCFFQNTCIIDKNNFDMITINAASEKVKEYKALNSKKIKKEFDLCTFMMSGYYEDGIDIILEYIKANKKDGITLGIKLPDYESVVSECYPGHNLPSKKYKCSGLLDKKLKEENLLKAKIYEMDLIQNVKLIKKNMTVFEIFDFIQKGNTFILLNRGLSVHFLIYSSILLNQKSVITEHSILDDRFKKYCFTVKTSNSNYAEEKHIAFSNDNVMRIARKIEFSSFNVMMIKLNNQEVEKFRSNDLEELIKEYSLKLDEFLINF